LIYGQRPTHASRHIITGTFRYLRDLLIVASYLLSMHFSFYPISMPGVYMSMCLCLPSGTLSQFSTDQGSLSSKALKYLGSEGKYANNLEEITFSLKFVLLCFRREVSFNKRRIFGGLDRQGDTASANLGRHRENAE